MAPFISTKRNRVADQQSQATASIKSCPAEIILDILQRLPTADVLNMRQVCSNAVGPCNDIITERCKTLYIHPSATSLRQAVEICANPMLAPGIEEVVILGKPMWRQIEAAYTGYRGGGSVAIPGPLVNVMTAGTRAHMQRPEWHFRFKPWPFHFNELHHNGLDKGAIRGCKIDAVPVFETWQEAGDSLLPVDESYATLITALSKLPKLHKLSYAQNVSEEHVGSSLNQVSQARITSHARKWAAQLPHGMIPQKIDQNHTCLPVRRSDASIFYGLLASPQLHFTSVTSDSALPFTEDIIDHIRARDTPIPSPGSLCALTHIDLLINAGWVDGQILAAYRCLLKHSRLALRSLRITFKPNASMTEPDLDPTLRVILGGLELPVLAKLSFEYLTTAHAELDGDNNKPPVPRKKGPHVNASGKPQRPLCFDLDIVALLRGSIATLTDVTFKNVIFDTFDPALEPLSGTLQLLGSTEAAELRRCSWTVARFTHHARCKRRYEEAFSFQGRRCEKLGCYLYTEVFPASWPRTTQENERIAGEMGILLDEDGRGWDFGESVMKKVRERREC